MNRNIIDLHPLMREPVRRLDERLKAEGLSFRLFEGYRPPERQDDLVKQRPRVTHARAWQSSHQYGLAVDYVWYADGKWSWGEDHPWERLAEIAKECGLSRPIKWDRPHLEHPAFRRVATAF